jgi:hypothetical protein
MVIKEAFAVHPHLIFCAGVARSTWCVLSGKAAVFWSNHNRFSPVWGDPDVLLNKIQGTGVPAMIYVYHITHLKQ